MATDTRLPTPIDDAFTILGGLAIPLMLLTLGHTLATWRDRSSSTMWRQTPTTPPVASRRNPAS